MKTTLIIFLMAACIVVKAQEKEIKPSTQEQADKSREFPQPLFVIDGVKKIISQEQDEKKKDLDEALNIKPDDIDSIEVLKGQDAIDKYGDEGKNGVILITTKNYKLKGRGNHKP